MKRNTDSRVTPGNRSSGLPDNSEFRVAKGTRSSVCLRQTGVPGKPGTIIYGLIQENGFKGYFENPEFQGTTRTKVTRGTGNPDFLVTPGTL